MRGFLLVATLVASLAVSAAGPKPLVIVPFGAAGSDARALSDAVALELVLDENLLVAPPEKVLDNLGMDVAEALPDDIMGALLQEEMAAMLRAEALPSAPPSVALFLHRARDGRVVWGRVVVIKETLDAPQDVAAEVSAAMAELETLPALSPAALTALTTPPVEAPTTTTTPTTTDAAPPTTTTTATPPTTTDAPAAEPAKPAPWPFDRVLRFAVFATPTFLHYEACQPDGTSLPFQCTPSPNVKSTTATVLPWGAPLSLGASLDATPWVPYVGLHVDASVFMTQLQIQGGEGLFDKTELNVFGGSFTGALSLTGAYAFSGVGIEGGPRVGYSLLWAIADPHFVTLDVGGVARDYAVVLLPPFFTHAVAAGLSFTVSYARWVRAVVDVDLLPLTLQVERDTTVSADPFLFGAGARGKLQLDVDLVFGTFVSGIVEGTTVSARGTGEGTRITRALTPFRDGVVGITHARAGLGFGWHF